jgi:hypothetical protein
VDVTGSPGAGVIETTLSTVTGRTYELVFHYARNSFLGTEAGDAQVEVVGSGILLGRTQLRLSTFIPAS